MLNKTPWRNIFVCAYMREKEREREKLSEGTKNTWPELYRTHGNINGLWACQYITLSPETRPAHYQLQKSQEKID